MRGACSAAEASLLAPVFNSPPTHPPTHLCWSSCRRPSRPDRSCCRRCMNWALQAGRRAGGQAGRQGGRQKKFRCNAVPVGAGWLALAAIGDSGQQGLPLPLLHLHLLLPRPRMEPGLPAPLRPSPHLRIAPASLAAFLPGLPSRRTAATTSSPSPSSRWYSSAASSHASAACCASPLPRRAASSPLRASTISLQADGKRWRARWTVGWQAEGKLVGLQADQEALAHQGAA